MRRRLREVLNFLRGFVDIVEDELRREVRGDGDEGRGRSQRQQREVPYERPLATPRRPWSNSGNFQAHERCRARVMSSRLRAMQGPKPRLGYLDPPLQQTRVLRGDRLYGRLRDQGSRDPFRVECVQYPAC